MGFCFLNTALDQLESTRLIDRGKEQLTDAVIRKLNKREKPLVFILWGLTLYKLPLIMNKKHLVIVGVHPGPAIRDRGFSAVNTSK